MSVLGRVHRATDPSLPSLQLNRDEIAAVGTYFQNRVPFLVCVRQQHHRYHFKAQTSLLLLAKCHTRTYTNDFENSISNEDDDYSQNGSRYFREIDKLAVEMNRKYLDYFFNYRARCWP